MATSYDSQPGVMLKVLNSPNQTVLTSSTVPCVMSKTYPRICTPLLMKGDASRILISFFTESRGLQFQPLATCKPNSKKKMGTYSCTSPNFIPSIFSDCSGCFPFNLVRISSSVILQRPQSKSSIRLTFKDNSVRVKYPCGLPQ